MQNGTPNVRYWDGPAVLLPRQRFMLARGTKDKEHAMSQTLKTAIAVTHAFAFVRLFALFAATHVVPCAQISPTRES